MFVSKSKNIENVKSDRRLDSSKPVESAPASASIFEKLTTPIIGPYKDIYAAEKATKRADCENNSNLDNATKQSGGYLGTLKRVGSMIWQHAKTPALVQGVASVIESSSALASMYFGAKLFRSYETVYQGGVAGAELAQNLAIVVGLGMVAAYGPLSRWVNASLHAKLTVGFNRDLMRAIGSRRQNELETESLRKEITTVNENRYRLPLLATQMVQTAGKTVEVGFASCFLGYMAYQYLGAGQAVVMSGLLLVSTLPRILSEMRHAKDVLNTEKNIAEVRRRSWYLSYFSIENDNVRELKGLGKHAEIQGRAIDAEKETLSVHVDTERRNAMQQLTAYTITRGTALGCAGVFVAKAWSGVIAPEVLGIAVGALYRFEGALAGISSMFGEQLKHFQFAHRAVKLIQDGERVTAEEERTRTETMDFESPVVPIRLVNVGYTYQGAGKPVLQKFNLTIDPGEFVAIVGPNGNGKTTLSKLIQGKYPPDSGVVFYGDKNLEQIKWSDISEYIATTGQDSKLFESLNIEQSVGLGRSLTREGLPMEEAINLGLADTFIRDTKAGLNTAIGSGFENGQELSSGQKQMVLASRVFHRDPRVLILDEPGANLDPHHDAELAKNLDEFGQRGCTRILITHNLRAAARRADRIIVMVDGTIQADGSHEHVMKNSSWYKSSYELQENGGNHQDKVLNEE